MNPVEIEEAVSQIASEPFDRAEFPFQFLTAFGNKKTTIDRLRKGNTNQSDLAGGVLQRSNIHIATSEPGQVGSKLTALRESPKTGSNKTKFILATDGEEFQAEDLASGETVACKYADFPDHFGFFLPLAGISTVRQIRESSFDIRATSRLNRLYVTLLQDNPEWAHEVRRPDLNHFMARLIFCFFAEDTDIFPATSGFTQTVERMSARDSSDTHDVIAELFRAMNTKHVDRAEAKITRWAEGFPYVNGNLFSGSTDVPRFSKIARSYLIHIGSLDWTRINPDIFGSMIQAVADDEERGALGMHYTSVPNILKVLNPLFLDDLRAKVEEAEGNARKLLNLRNRMAKIRVFDPACGSGNFLVIAYKEMRSIEAEINQQRGEPDRRTDIPLTNFRGIELRDFPAEIARLALIIAEYQCDVLYRGQKEALAEFLPLDSENWITCGNALRFDWLSICPPTGTGVKVRSDDLFEEPLNNSEIDFENSGGETFICGNPPYIGTKYQDANHKSDLALVFFESSAKVGNIDYVGGWFKKAASYLDSEPSTAVALVTTSSLFQGEQAELMFTLMRTHGLSIQWCHESFKWSNHAASNAAVICCIVSLRKVEFVLKPQIFSEASVRAVANIGPYLVAMPDIVVTKRNVMLSELSPMCYGSMSNDNNEFTFSFSEFLKSVSDNPDNSGLFRIAIGGKEFVRGLVRPAIYIDCVASLSDSQLSEFSEVFERVRTYRSQSPRAATRKLAETPFAFAERRHTNKPKIFVPQVLSEKRPYVTAGFLSSHFLVIAPHMQIPEGSLYDFSVLSSRAHLVWISTVCGRLKTDLRYSNTLGWNTFPLPKLTEQNKAELTRCAENILLAREAHFPATIADLYDPEAMPEDLRRAHEENDEVLERIYIGRRFRNDTERLEKLFELYVKMTGKKVAA